MAYLMLHGTGWTQRWPIADGMEDQIRSVPGRPGVRPPGPHARAGRLRRAADQVRADHLVAEVVPALGGFRKERQLLSEA